MLDKRGRDVYFAESPAVEYDLATGLAIKEAATASGTLTLTMRTDNWGYFQTVFERVMSNSTSGWRDYDCFLSIGITAGVCSILWIIIGAFEIHAFRVENWGFAIKVLC